MELQDNLCILCSCNSVNSNWTFQDTSSASQLIVAIANVWLVAYIFINQRRELKELREEDKTSQLKALKLQNFKDFILTPSFQELQLFFSNLSTLRTRIVSARISDYEAIEFADFIKNEVRQFRRNFNDGILHVNNNLYAELKKEVEQLTDDLIKTIVDGNYDLTDSNLYDNRIGNPINYSKHKVISLLIQYKGE